MFKAKGAARKQLIVHPFFFAAFPPLALLANNLWDIPIESVYPSFIASIALALVLQAFVFVLVRSFEKSALLVSLFLVFFFSFGHLYHLLASFKPFGIQIVRYRFFVPLLGILFVLFAYGVTKIKRGLALLTHRANAASCFLLLTLLPLTGWTQFQKQFTWYEKLGIPLPVSVDQKRLGTAGLPDIYYIILDGYARHDFMLETYGYDNSEFLNKLKNFGFYIAEKSRSNYHVTMLSLPSSLNFIHLDTLHEYPSFQKHSSRYSRNMFKNNRLAAFLKQRGYSFVSYNSPFSFSNIPTADDYRSQKLGLGEFEGLFLELTPLPLLVGITKLKVFEKTYRRNLLFIFEDLPLHSSDSPRFVFAHILLPHWPFVFRADGNELDNKEMDPQHSPMSTPIHSREEYQNLYKEQAEFVSWKITETIEKILSKSKEPPIIILQADHGPAFYEINFQKIPYLSLVHSHDRIALERAAILNAYLLPPPFKGKLYDSITPVNTFRLILNHYFGTRMELLEDLTFSNDPARPWTFVNVTKELDALEGRG